MSYIFYLLFLLSCAGCGAKKSIRHEKFQNQEMIARYSDLPDAPFQVKLQSIVVNPEDHDQVQMFYTTTTPIQELAYFYQQQMERCGWDLLDESHVQDWLLNYIKPTKVCSILITGNKLTLYLGNKKGA